MTVHQPAALHAKPAIASHLPVLDGIRGIAISMVLLFHIWEMTWLDMSVGPLTLNPIGTSGFLGVELFFFLSGFVIFDPYVRAWLSDAPTPTIRDFVRKRFLKIVPSYYLAIIILVATGYQHYGSLAEAGRDLTFHAVFIHNWFSQTYGSIDGVMWSLGTEVQFYLVFPMLAWAFLRKPILCASGMIATAIIFRTAIIHSYFFHQLLTQLPAVLDLFALGMASSYVYRYLEKSKPQLPGRRWVTTCAALAGVAAVCAMVVWCHRIRFDPDAIALWQAHYRTLFGLTIAWATVGLLFAAPFLQKAVANVVLVFLAAISYNLYIWHQVIGRLLIAVHIPAHVGSQIQADHHWQVAFSVVAVLSGVVVATLVTYLFEQPIVRLGRTRRRAISGAVPLAQQAVSK
ncbi:MAG: acyltransferase family protein [Candidatus Eremiobacter antarcticus]|nr:acyltransferase [Candidatus Eremiobacteraeota bacterium]MBC5808641.1 acyltransferase [Candidatus Eremiobacteraeota bacterium]